MLPAADNDSLAHATATGITKDTHFSGGNIGADGNQMNKEAVDSKPNNGEPTYAYPDYEVMRKIYDKIHAQEIKNSEFYIHNPSLAFLKGMYDDRVRAGTIDPISHTYMGPEERGPEERGPEEISVPVRKFDVRTADQLIVDANGKTTGYLDRTHQEYDINGLAVPKSKVANAVETKAVYPVPYYVIYKSANFNDDQNGRSAIFGTTSTMAARVNPFQTTGSLIVAPGVTLQVTYGANTTTYYGNENGLYLTGFGNGFRISTLKVLAAPVSRPTKQCGWVHKDVNYGGAGLPIYDNRKYDFTESPFNGWNDAISSATFPNKSCGKVVGTTHRDFPEPGNRRLGFHAFQNWENLITAPDLHTTVRKNFNDQLTTLETSNDLVIDGRRVTEEDVGNAIKVFDVANGRKGKTFWCNWGDSACAPDPAKAVGSIGVGMCALAFGTAFITGLGAVSIASSAVLATLSPGGVLAAPTAAAVTEAFAAVSVTETAKGLACLAGVYAVYTNVQGLCKSEEEKWCADQLNTRY